MHASLHFQPHHMPWSAVCRWCARAIGVVLIVGWTAYAIAELFHPDYYVSPGMIYQGAALATVFAGYAIGWRWELLGGLLAVGGTAAFFVAYALDVGTPPRPELALAWFAAPGVLYLAAWRSERHGADRRTQTGSERPIAA